MGSSWDLALLEAHRIHLLDRFIHVGLIYLFIVFLFSCNRIFHCGNTGQLPCVCWVILVPGSELNLPHPLHCTGFGRKLPGKSCPVFIQCTCRHRLQVKPSGEGSLV